MRKILLAGVATIAMTGVAAAAGLEPILGTASGNPNTGLWGTAAPGKSVVRLDGYVFFGAGYNSSTLDNAPAAGGTAKNDSFAFLSGFRIFPSFDAQTAGGLRYGAFAEIRSNPNTGGVANPAGTGVTGGGGGAGISNARGTNTLNVNRAFGYVGSDQLGMLSFGTRDGVAAIMRVGTFEGFTADGGWNGTTPNYLKGSYSTGVMPYRFSVGGGFDLGQKINYLSPIWSGVQVGFSFAPSTATNQWGDGLVGTGGGARQSASALLYDVLQRPRNIYQVSARYTGTFGGVGTQVTLGYIGSQAIRNVGGLSVNGGVTPRGLSVVTAGATVSFQGFTVGGYMNSGRVNNNFQPINPGDKSSMVYTLGAGYTQGPWTTGVAYTNASQAGLTGNGAQRADVGWAAGVTYAYAPGARVYLEFVTGTARERGVNLTNYPLVTANVGKAISATGLIIGNTFRW